MKDDSAWPWDHCPFTCYSGEAASQDAMTANCKSLCQDEAGQCPEWCTRARLLVASAGPVSCVLTGAHPTLALATSSGSLPGQAELSSHASDLESLGIPKELDFTV